MVHSELIMSIQYIEQDLKLVYAAVKGGDIDRNFAELEKMNLGKVICEFRDLDKKTGFAQFSDDSYYSDPEEHYEAYSKVAERLHYDENHVFELQ